MLLHRRLAASALALYLMLDSGCAWKGHMRAGDAAMLREDYGAAVAAYALALADKPEKVELQAKLAAAKSARVKHLEAETRRHLAAGKCQAAIASAATAMATLPRAAEVLAGEVVDFCGQRARDLTAKAQYAAGKLLLDALLSGLPTASRGLQPDLKLLKERWTAQLVEAAEQALAVENWATALLLQSQRFVLEAKAAGPSLTSLAEKAMIRSSYRLAGLPAADDALARQLLAALKEQRGAQLIEWISSLDSADTVFRLAVGPMEFAERSTQREKQVRFQSGTTQVANPSYRSAEDRVLSEERRLVEHENEVSESEQRVDDLRSRIINATPEDKKSLEARLRSAEQTLRRARDDVREQRDRLLRAKESLSRTEQYETRPVYSTVPLTITRHELVGWRQLIASFQDVNFVEGSATAPEIKLEVQHHASDESHSALPVASVSEDPLSLPPDSEFERILEHKAITALQGIVLDNHSQHRKALRDKAMALAGAAKLEGLLVYLLSDVNARDEEVEDIIYRMSGVPEAGLLLAAWRRPGLCGASC